MSKIEWTDKTWNPVIGCAKVSAGCKNCYAERSAHRVASMQGGGVYLQVLRTETDERGYIEQVDPRWNGRAVFLPERLGEPLHWRKPCRVFVNSMSDLFHEDITFGQISAVFGVMAATPHLTYQVLTKRPARMLEFFRSTSAGASGVLIKAAVHIEPESAFKERQAFIDPPPGHMAKEFTSADGSRKFYMYEAAQAGRHHFVKGCDPVPWEGDTACWLWYPPDVDLLETSIDTFERFQNREECVAAAWSKVLAHSRNVDVVWPLPNVHIGVSVEDQDAADERIPLLLQCPAALRFLSVEPLLERVSLLRWTCGEHGRRHIGAPPGLGWVIVGGESGPGARPCDVEWIRSVVEQCKGAGVPVFVKQLGAAPRYVDGVRQQLRDRKGADPSEWPEDLRVQECPEGRV